MSHHTTSAIALSQTSSQKDEVCSLRILHPLLSERAPWFLWFGMHSDATHRELLQSIERAHTQAKASESLLREQCSAERILQLMEDLRRAESISRQAHPPSSLPYSTIDADRSKNEGTWLCDGPPPTSGSECSDSPPDVQDCESLSASAVELAVESAVGTGCRLTPRPPELSAAHFNQTGGAANPPDGKRSYVASTVRQAHEAEDDDDPLEKLGRLMEATFGSQVPNSKP